MDILISAIAVFAAGSCFAAIVTAEWRDRKKRRAAEAKIRNDNRRKARVE